MNSGYTNQLNFLADVPPLRQDEGAVIRIGSTRVLLENVIRAFQDGATPEAIVQRYPTTTLAEVNSVIAYYLRHRTLVDGYLAERERVSESTQREIEAAQPDLAELRRRLLARARA